MATIMTMVGIVAITVLVIVIFFMGLMACMAISGKHPETISNSDMDRYAIAVVSIMFYVILVLLWLK